jgi:hypothetical protein
VVQYQVDLVVEALGQDPGGVFVALAGAPSVAGGDPGLGLFPVGRPDLLDLLAGQGAASGGGRVLDALAPGAQHLDYRGRPGLEARLGLGQALRGPDQVCIAQLTCGEADLVLGVAVVVVGDQTPEADPCPTTTR